MPKSFNQKCKILYLAQMFLQDTDERNKKSIADMIEMLDRNGIHAERKSLYDDIETLRTFGLDILNHKQEGYYLASRTFELPELKLLVDAVQSSKFITQKKSNELISKLESLTSHHEAGQLQRQVMVTNRIKTMNESIYYNVDAIHSALQNNRQISFQYYEWNVKKQMQPRKDGALYQVSPWALCWDDENYYLISFDAQSEMIRHYRVDKMMHISQLEQSRDGRKAFEGFDTAVYAKKVFGMYGGTEEQVEIVFDNVLVGVIIDRFGKDIAIHRHDEETFTIKVNVSVSNQFFGWLCGLGDTFRIMGPESVRDEYQNFLKKLQEKSGI